MNTPIIRIIKVQEGIDGTKKYVLGLQDGNLIEAIALNLSYRGIRSNVVCISSQVGCARRCKFCLTGVEGLSRNMTCEEIVAQVMTVVQSVGWERKSSIDVTFMGQGEPLDNLNAVSQSIIAIDRQIMSKLYVNISTIGIPEKIRKLAQHDFTRLHLQISLHHSDESKRKMIMPFTKLYSLKEIVNASAEFGRAKRDRVCLNYIAWDFNTTREDARRLVDLISDNSLFYVKISKYNNNVPGDIFSDTSSDQLAMFTQEIKSSGIEVKNFHSWGTDILAGCGELTSRKD